MVAARRTSLSSDNSNWVHLVVERDKQGQLNFIFISKVKIVSGETYIRMEKLAIPALLCTDTMKIGLAYSNIYRYSQPCCLTSPE